MIELTDEQVRAMEACEAIPPRLVNPRMKETFVLLAADEYSHLKKVESDDRPSGPRRFGTLKGSIVSIAPDIDDFPQGFEDYLP